MRRETVHLMSTSDYVVLRKVIPALLILANPVFSLPAPLGLQWYHPNHTPFLSMQKLYILRTKLIDTNPGILGNHRGLFPLVTSPAFNSPIRKPRRKGSRASRSPSGGPVRLLIWGKGIT
jgi:hypothetical protein